MDTFFTSAKAFWERLTTQQRMALIGVVAGSILLLSVVGYWSSRPEMTLLFGRLGPTDANTVIETLQTDGVPYELRENGTAVYVPKERVYELRLQFAAQGLGSDSQAGYELFDAGTLGMTDFMQRLNLKRALEGELARTIASVRQIETARVHLVIPERSAFQEQQEQPTASVVVQTLGGQRLSSEQVDGITSLVAGAVEGLQPENVTVLDVRGNLLSNPDRRDEDTQMTTAQLRMQRSIEQHLTESGQSMLDRVLGPGNAIVRVSANIDFSRAVQERDLIDPESSTIISEERLQEEGAAGGNANSVVRNFELSRTRERMERGIGDVRYISVSVIVNQKAVPAADGTVAEPVAYSEEELRQIEALVQNAVGFRPDRGDTFALHQTRFDTSADDEALAAMREVEQRERLALYLRYGIVALALLVVVWLIRSVTQRFLSPKSPLKVDARSLTPAQLAASSVGPDGKLLTGVDGAEDEEEDMVMIDDIYSSKLSPEAKARLKARHLVYEEIKDHVKQKPEEAADLIRSWLVGDMEEVIRMR